MAYSKLYDFVLVFLKRKNALIPRENWQEYLATRTISYTGVQGKKAQALTHAQIIDGLPPKERCASISLLDLAEGSMYEFLAHPLKSLVPLTGQKRPRPGKVMSSRKETELIAKELLDRGLVVPLLWEELIFI